MHIESTLKTMHAYVQTQTHGVTSYTISKRVGITPKQARYLIKTYIYAPLSGKQSCGKAKLIYTTDFKHLTQF